MMMTLIRWKINGCVHASTADDDKNPDTQLFHQKLCKILTKFDIVKYDKSTIRKTYCKRQNLHSLCVAFIRCYLFAKMDQ